MKHCTLLFLAMLQSVVFFEMQEIQNNQKDLEKVKHSWRTQTSRWQKTKTKQKPNSNQDRMELARTDIRMNQIELRVQK